MAERNELERSVLHKHYVQLKTFNQIAEEEFYTKTWILQVHAKALKNLNNLLKSIP